ncbi:MAG: hypothetical protein ACRC6X_08900, partial [Culicoidibacterales bacterium]
FISRVMNCQNLTEWVIPISRFIPANVFHCVDLAFWGVRVADCVAIGCSCLNDLVFTVISVISSVPISVCFLDYSSEVVIFVGYDCFSEGIFFQKKVVVGFGRFIACGGYFAGDAVVDVVGCDGFVAVAVDCFGRTPFVVIVGFCCRLLSCIYSLIDKPLFGKKSLPTVLFVCKLHACPHKTAK